MALATTGTTERSTVAAAAARRGRHRRVGAAGLGVALVAGAIWLTWRGEQLGTDPIPIALFVLDAVGVGAGLLIGVGLLASSQPTAVPALDGPDLVGPMRFHAVVAASTGRRAPGDLRLHARVELGNARWRPSRRLGALAVLAAVSDPIRRAAQILLITISLLRGVGPYPVPPLWSALAFLVGVAAVSSAHVALSGGRIRTGDRLRNSYAAMGDLLRSTDRDGLLLRRWVYVVGAAVLPCLAVGLRGTSDRWTHGFAPMGRDERMVLIVVAMALAGGALLTLRSMSAPVQPDSHLVSRHLEERTARQSALGGAVCVGLVGLVAGILPGSVDAADDDVIRVERVTDLDGVHGIGSAPEPGPAEGSDG